MMKLQYLHDNRAMVHDILRRWPHDADRLDWLDRYRISANAVYPFSSGGKLHFLRFSPVSEKRDGQVQAEMDWIKFLTGKGVAVIVTVPSLAGKETEQMETQWGTCTACVFEGVEGQRYDWMDWDPLPEEALRAAGVTLARMHEAGRENWQESVPHHPWDWREVLDWCEQTVSDIPQLPEGALGTDDAGHPRPKESVDQEAVHAAAEHLRTFFGGLPITPDVYGPIHYDFEMDNLFWQPEMNRCVPIDFDDLMIHWYAFDLVKTRDSIRETMADVREETGATADDPIWSEAAAKAEACLLEGYQSVRAIPEFSQAQQAAFSQFAALFGYARILHSVRQVDPEEPEWMTGLRSHLRELLAQRREVWSRNS